MKAADLQGAAAEAVRRAEELNLRAEAISGGIDDGGLCVERWKGCWSSGVMREKKMGSRGRKGRCRCSGDDARTMHRCARAVEIIAFLLGDPATRPAPQTSSALLGELWLGHAIRADPPVGLPSCYCFLQSTTAAAASAVIRSLPVTAALVSRRGLELAAGSVEPRVRSRDSSANACCCCS